jgi:protein disulfide-isomerase
MDDSLSQMNMMRPPALLALCLSLLAHGADFPYDEGADAKRDIRRALSEATQARVPVLVVFGTNWCGDCKMLDKAMKEGTSAPLIAREFRVVKVDVGRYDRNLDIAESYGVPLKKGIPAVAILSARNEVLYATRAGELADARGMGESGVYEFFKRVTADTGPRM